MAWKDVLFPLLTYVARNIPQPENAPPVDLSQVDVPTAEAGREIPVLFGTREIKNSNVVWYGDFKAVAIKKKGGKK